MRKQGMGIALAPIAAELGDHELPALIPATCGVPQTAPGLLAWIDGACDWELNRRRGLDYTLLSPDGAIRISAGGGGL